MKRTILLVLVALCAFTFISCATTIRKHEKLPPLYGTIFDQENKPVASIDLYLDGSYAATSDIHGHFSLLSVKKTEEHSLEARKKGYEKVELKFTYTDPTQVMYISMFSADQLLSAAEQALRDKDWISVESFLQRAQSTGADEIYCNYLQAVLYAFKNDEEKAKDILLEMTDKGYENPHILLFLADIYEFHDKNYEMAIHYLNKYLSVRPDIDIDLRIRKLSASQH